MIFLTISANKMLEHETTGMSIIASPVWTGHLFVFGCNLAWCYTSCHLETNRDMACLWFPEAMQPQEVLSSNQPPGPASLPLGLDTTICKRCA